MAPEADDQRLRIPKAAAQVVVRAIEKNHGPYYKLAKAFEERDWDAVEQIAETDEKEFEKVRIIYLQASYRADK